MIPRIVVFGGNGFLGKRICQEAISSGFEVLSLSRSGKAPVPQSPHDRKWIDQVNWKSADVFNPESYRTYLQGSSNVVHSMGILLEDESYKMRVKSPMTKSFDFKSFIPSFGANPLEKKNPNFTYERMNKQSALILAQAFRSAIEASQTKGNDIMPTFTYISADKGFPLIPKGYINSKREAEAALMRYEDVFRPILARPGFMFDEYRRSNDARSYVHHALEFLNCSNKILLGKKLQFVNDLVRPTVSTQQVSKSILSKIKDPSFEGVLPLESIINTN